MSPSPALMTVVSALCVVLSYGNALEGDGWPAIMCGCTAALCLIAALVVPVTPEG